VLFSTLQKVKSKLPNGEIRWLIGELGKTGPKVGFQNHYGQDIHPIPFVLLTARWRSENRYS
jgi:hypothetical protein